LKYIIHLIILSSFFWGQDLGYFAGWPINDSKDEINDPGVTFECDENVNKKNAGCPCSSDADCITGKCFRSPRIGNYCLQGKGTMFPRFKLIDQYGEEVDIYDFANQGKMIIIEFSTAWCKPCRELAAWLSYNDTSVTQSRMWKPEYDIIKDLVQQDQIYFINIQIQDIYKDSPSLDSVEDWFQEYSDDKIPVLADSGYQVRDWMKITGYPTIILINERMEIEQFSIRGWHDAFNFLSAMDWNFEKPAE